MARPSGAVDGEREEDAAFFGTFLDDEARDPSSIRPRAIVVTGNHEVWATSEVVDLVEHATGTVVRLCLLRGTTDDYRAQLRRAAEPTALVS